MAKTSFWFRLFENFESIDRHGKKCYYLCILIPFIHRTSINATKKAFVEVIEHLYLRWFPNSILCPSATLNNVKEGMLLHAKCLNHFGRTHIPVFVLCTDRKTTCLASVLLHGVSHSIGGGTFFPEHVSELIIDTRSLSQVSNYRIVRILGRNCVYF